MKRPDSEPKSDATLIVELLTNMEPEPELFHAPNGKGHIRFQSGPAIPLHSEAFSELVLRRFYQEHGRVPNTQGAHEAARTLAAKAKFEGPMHPVFVRVGAADGHLYLDLGDAEGNVVMITDGGWGVITDVDVRFLRPPGQEALPIPETGGSLSELAAFCNYSTDDDLLLIAAALCAWVRPTGPYPVLVLHGHHGSAKSTTAKLLKQIVDPDNAVLQTPPTNVRDLMIAASNTHVLSIDNVSRLSITMSDAFCRLSTGAAFTTRQLYTDTGQVTLNMQRPVIMNGIGNIVERADLLDRSLIIELPTINAERRMRGQLIQAEFERAHPRLLGAVLDAAVLAHANVESIELTTNPRMMDFATWGAAMAPALSRSAADFESAYHANRHSGHLMALEGSAIGLPLVQFVRSKGQWVGEATELLRHLLQTTPPRLHQRLPDGPAALGTEIMRIAPALDAIGIEVLKSRRWKGGRRRLTLRQRPDNGIVVSGVSDALASDGPDDMCHGAAPAPDAADPIETSGLYPPENYYPAARPDREQPAAQRHGR